MRKRGAADVSKLRITIAASVLAAASVLGGVAQVAQAQDNQEFREVPIGTFTIGKPHDGFSVVEPPAGVPEAKDDESDNGSGRWFFQRWEKTSPPQDAPADLYSDAMKALDAGHTDEAQRLFERLVAEAPASTEATEARQHLGRIYRGVAAKPSQPAEAAPVAGPPLTSTDTATGALPWSTQGAPATTASVNTAPVLPRSVLYRARVSSAIDGQFLSDAGDRVFFSAGSANLGVRARAVIQAQARFLIRHPELSAAVEGHADDGALPDAETQRLSDERAAVVRDRLIAEGVEADRLTAYGRGREDRVSDCPAPECLAQNRRAITVLLDGRLLLGDGAIRRVQGESSDLGFSPTQ